MPPRVISVGVDIVSTARLGRVYERFGARFLRKAFSASEVSEFEQRSRKRKERGVQFLASRWAAKEAAFKALSSATEAGNVSRVKFTDMSVVHNHIDSGSGVTLALQGSARDAAEKQGAYDVHLRRDYMRMCSLSHEVDYAVALVVLTGRSTDSPCV